MINKIEYSVRNLTSIAGLFILLEHANKIGIFDLIDKDLVIENISIKNIKTHHIKTMLWRNFTLISLGEWHRKTGTAEIAASRSRDQ